MNDNTLKWLTSHLNMTRRRFLTTVAGSTIANGLISNQAATALHNAQIFQEVDVVFVTK